jgi:hypothetical protein
MGHWLFWGKRFPTVSRDPSIGNRVYAKSGGAITRRFPVWKITEARPQDGFESFLNRKMYFVAWWISSPPVSGIDNNRPHARYLIPFQVRSQANP